MGNRPPREQSTRELLAEFERRRARRRRAQLALVALAGLLLVVALSAAAAAAIRGLVLDNGPQPPSTVLVSLSSSTTERAPTTTYALPPRPSTTVPAEEVPAAESSTTTVQPTSTSNSVPQEQGLVVIDPGHQARGDSAPEPIGPGSNKTKPRVAGGTRGVATGIAEHELALAVGLKLRAALERRGVEVLMTRTTASVNISNLERTKIANQARADLYVRIHADGSPNGNAARGIHVLYPASIKGWTDDVAGPSKRAAELAQRALIAATGAPNLGIDSRDDMTGFNWSDVPVIIPEIGFMTNPEEDRLLASDSYRQKIADALAEAAVLFLEERR